MSQPLISVIVLNFNGGHVLPQCLAAMGAQTFKDFELLVVDNASTDGSVEGLEAQFSQVKVIQLTQNLGFAKGNNFGVGQARGKWICLLNNDAYPEPNWLERLAAATEQYPEYAFFACKLIAHTMPYLLDGTGDVCHVSGVVWSRQHLHPTALAVDKYDEVFSPTGAAALYRRDAFETVGGFDTDFISYHEDIDLGFRLRLQGYRCLYVPDAVVRHVGSATYGKRSDFAVRNGHRNMVWCYVQNMPAALFWRYLPQFLLANLAFVVYLSLRGQARAIWTAKWHALLGLPMAFRKRKVLQRSRKISGKDLLQILDRGVMNPYLLGYRARKLARDHAHPAA